MCITISTNRPIFMEGRWGGVPYHRPFPRAAVVASAETSLCPPLLCSLLTPPVLLKQPAERPLTAHCHWSGSVAGGQKEVSLLTACTLASRPCMQAAGGETSVWLLQCSPPTPQCCCSGWWRGICLSAGRQIHHSAQQWQAERGLSTGCLCTACWRDLSPAGAVLPATNVSS